MEKFGVIMAGGGGTRFWPLSRKTLPKQFLNLTGNDLLINETIDRLSSVMDKGHIYTVANQSHAATILNVTNGRIIPRHIISEPVARNTLACIGYAAISIFTEYGDGIMVATPSDAYIDNTEAYAEVLNKAMKAAEDEDKIVTIGINPRFPATGYGYIKYSDVDSDVKPVEQFVEKPDKETAERYIKENYLWNSGMFVVKISVLLEAIKKYASDVYKDIESLGMAVMQSNFEKVDEIYPNIRKISFDYAIAEPASLNNQVIVIPGEFGWSDVGTWDMIDAIHKPDENGNVLVGDTLSIDTTETVVFSQKKFVATLGVANLVIVDTKDALLICDKSHAQEVRLIVDKLEESGHTDLI